MNRDFLEELKQLVLELRGGRAEHLTAATRIAHDLHLEGDDAEEFLLRYAKQFSVDLSEFEFARHFSGEGILPELFWRLRHGHPIRMVPLTLGDLATAAARGRWSYHRDLAV